MHELSLALNLVDLAREEAARAGGRVCVVHLRLGRLAGVVKEALLSSYEMACLDTPLEGSRLEIEEVPVVVHCERCGVERVLESTQWFSCPVCGEPTADVRQGRELELVALEIES